MILSDTTRDQLDQFCSGQLDQDALDRVIEELVTSIDQAVIEAEKSYHDILGVYHEHLNALNGGQIREQTFQRRCAAIRYMAMEWIHQSRFLLSLTDTWALGEVDERFDAWAHRIEILEAVVVSRIHESPHPVWNAEFVAESREAYRRGEGIDLRQQIAKLLG